MTEGAHSRRKFPVLLAVTQSYEIVFGRFSTYVRVVAPWATTGFVVTMAIWLSKPTQAVAPDQRMIAAVATSMTVLALLVVVSAGVVNAWHRVVLQEWTPRGWGFSVAGLAGYSVRAVVLYGGFLLVTLGAYLLAELLFFASETLLSLLGVLLLGCALVVGRASLALPAASIGERRVTFLKSWALTRGGSWRLLAGGLLVSLPPFVGYQLILTLISDSGLTSGFPLAPLRAGALVAGWMIVVGLGATYHSLAYRFFVEGRDRLDGGMIDTLKEQFS